MIHYKAITFAADFVVQPCPHPSCSCIRTANIRTRYTAINLPRRKRNEYDPVLLFRGLGGSGYRIQCDLYWSHSCCEISKEGTSVFIGVRTEHADDELAKVEENGVD